MLFIPFKDPLGKKRILINAAKIVAVEERGDTMTALYLTGKHQMKVYGSLDDVRKNLETYLGVPVPLIPKLPHMPKFTPVKAVPRNPAKPE